MTDEEKINILTAALVNIQLHTERIGGANAVKFSSWWRIAEDALEKCGIKIQWTGMEK